MINSLLVHLYFIACESHTYRCEIKMCAHCYKALKSAAGKIKCIEDDEKKQPALISEDNLRDGRVFHCGRLSVKSHQSYNERSWE